MILRISNEEFDLMRTALSEYRRSLREQERVQCHGYSEAGIELCGQRLRLDLLLTELGEQLSHHAPGAPSKVEPIPLRARASAAATPERVA